MGADPEDLRSLATRLGRAVAKVAWLRRRIGEATAQARVGDAGTAALWRLEEWLDRNASALRGRAARLEEGDPSGDPHLPGYRPGGCGTVAVPVQGRRRDASGRDTPLGEPLFASAALRCGPASEWRRDEGLQLVPVAGRLVLMAKGRRGRGGSSGPPPPPPPTKEERLDKARLPHGDDAEFAYVPEKSWHPTQRLPWSQELRGFIDSKGDVWRKGRSVTPGDPFEWDVQLAPNSPWKVFSKEGRHLNIDLRGRISH